jgi:hypothetical protein
MRNYRKKNGPANLFEQRGLTFSNKEDSRVFMVYTCSMCSGIIVVLLIVAIA